MLHHMALPGYNSRVIHSENIYYVPGKVLGAGATKTKDVIPAFKDLEVSNKLAFVSPGRKENGNPWQRNGQLLLGELVNTIPLEPPTGECRANNPRSLNNSPCFLSCLCLSGPGHDDLVFPEVRPSVMLVLRNALGNIPRSNARGKCYSSSSRVGISQVSRDPAGSYSVASCVTALPWEAFLTQAFSSA